MTTATLQFGESIEMTSAPVLAGLAGLYERHYEAVFRTALRVTGRPADAEDVLQTVFVRLLSGSEHDEAARRPAAYFRRAAVNAAVDLLRRRATHGETVYDNLGRAGAVESSPLLKEQLRRALATLETDDATLFLLRYVEGLRLDEVAKVLRQPVGTAKSNVHRGVNALREALSESRREGVKK